MIKYILLFVLKRMIKILNFNKRFLIKFAPFQTIYLKIIASFLFIKSILNILKGYKIFKFLNVILRFLSFSSLFINFILFILIMEIDIVGWTPQVKSYLNNSNWLPNNFKYWLLDWWYKIVYIFSLFWNWLTDYLSYILTKILEIIKGKETTPIESIIDPDKYKFGDTNNKEYINNLTQTLDEYKFYILLAIGVVAIGILTYTYWDSISNVYRRGGNNGDTPDPLEPDVPSPIPSEPSIGRDVDSYPNGYLYYFSNKLDDLVRKVKTRAGELYVFRSSGDAQGASDSGISSNVGIPKGLYRNGNQVMWQGNPVPRVENLNGVDYYISLDKDKFINIMDSTRSNDYINIINPISMKSVGNIPIPYDGKCNFIKEGLSWPQFDAPLSSWIRKPEISNLYIGQPSVSSLSMDESKLPSFEKSSPIPIPSKGKERFFDSFEDIQLSPRVIDLDATPTQANINLPKYNVGDNWPSGSTTPTPSNISPNIEYLDMDQFT